MEWACFLLYSKKGEISVIIAHMAFFTPRRAAVDLSRKKQQKKFGLPNVATQRVLLILLVLCLSFFAYHYYRMYTRLRDVSKEIPQQQKTPDNPAAIVVAAVERHILLPQGEQPLVAKVTDVKLLANIPFFGNALPGDEVIVYCKNSLSVLYSPARDKVIEVIHQPVNGACPSK